MPGVLRSNPLYPNMLFCIVGVFFVLCTGCTTTQTKKPLIDTALSAPIAEDKAGDPRLRDLSHDQLIAQGNAFLKQKNYKMAQLNFAMAKQKSEKSPEALTGLAKVSLAYGSRPQADSYYQKALQIDPNYSPALLGKARITRLRGNTTEAIEMLGTALTNDPDNALLATELGLCYESLGKVKMARPWYEKAVELQPDQAFTHNNLGFNCLLSKEYQKALNEFSRAIAIAPNSVKFKNNLAAAYALLGKEDKALQIFKNTVGAPGAYNNLGYLYMTMQEWDKAEKAFHRALDISPAFYEKAQINLDRLNDLRKASP